MTDQLSTSVVAVTHIFPDALFHRQGAKSVKEKTKKLGALRNFTEIIGVVL